MILVCSVYIKDTAFTTQMGCKRWLASPASGWLVPGFAPTPESSINQAPKTNEQALLLKSKNAYNFFSSGQKLIISPFFKKRKLKPIIYHVKYMSLLAILNFSYKHMRKYSAGNQRPFIKNRIYIHVTPTSRNLFQKCANIWQIPIKFTFP